MNRCRAAEGILSATPIIRTAKAGPSRLRTQARLLAMTGLCSVTFLAQAQTNYQRIKSFDASPAGGQTPWGQLIQTADGYLVGTTYGGGSASQGTLFRLRTDGGEHTIVLSFTNGAFPTGELLLGTDGVLYGSTSSGGSSSFGILFKVNPDGSGYMTLHEFTGSAGSDGATPCGSLAQGFDGMLYGTTQSGGTNGSGVIFRISTNGTGYTILRQLNSMTNGAAFPYAGMIHGSDGVLYGTTQGGGSNGIGTVFSMAVDGSGFQVLHHFIGDLDGYWPLGRLLEGSDGFLYGTTHSGGSSNFGTVYRLNKTGGEYEILHQFTGGMDGKQPYGGLAEGAGVVMYGSTRYGGPNDVGTAFKLNGDGAAYAVIHSFAETNGDGTQPGTGLLVGNDGAVYGTTLYGGQTNAGTLFRLMSTAPPFRIVSIRRDGSNAVVQCSGGVAGQSYRLQARPHLTLGIWRSAKTNAAGVDGTFQYVDTTAWRYPVLFYRCGRM